MATTTTNYGFDVPTSSDLVKNGATAISTLGQDIDTFLFRPFSKNVLINGGMDIWQRGTSISASAFDYKYTADRWLTFNGAACTVSQETSTVPAGSRYALKLTGGATTSSYEMWQVIETANAIGLAGQTATLSVYATGTTGSLCSVTLDYSTGTDTGASGSWTAITPSSTATSLTSGTFSRITTTVSVPSIAKSLRVRISTNSLTSGQFQIYGNAQLEIGSQVSPFTRAGGTIQGELAACQRYYYRSTSAGNYNFIAGTGMGRNSTSVFLSVPIPVTMRTAAATLDFSNLILDDAGAVYAITSMTLTSNGNPNNAGLLANVASGITVYRPYMLASNIGAGYVGLSAEL